jgi:hypothetical protein
MRILLPAETAAAEIPEADAEKMILAAGLWVARQMTRRVDMLSSDRGLTTRLSI